MELFLFWWNITIFYSTVRAGKINDEPYAIYHLGLVVVTENLSAKANIIFYFINRFQGSKTTYHIIHGSQVIIS
ncbi:MAG: hypothetical protein K0S26_1522 [Bacteroidota bacterium]|nr:hypothetical protein [Bacteroidota bacterium]